VFVVDNDVASKREVSVGTADDSYIAITKGLKVGDPVIVGPAKTLLFLKQGEHIKVNVKAVEGKDSNSSSSVSVSRND
jgi:HlyD family secretion protein